jgi:ATP-binding cassette subfamily B protein
LADHPFLLPYLWEFKWRVVIALSLLVLSNSPMFPCRWCSRKIDAMDKPQAALAVPVFTVVGYGVLRLLSTLFGECATRVFAKAIQRAIRRVALQVFGHLHSLSLRFISTGRPAACRATSSAARAESAFC